MSNLQAVRDFIRHPQTRTGIKAGIFGFGIGFGVGKLIHFHHVIAFAAIVAVFLAAYYGSMPQDDAPLFVPRGTKWFFL